MRPGWGYGYRVRDGWFRFCRLFVPRGFWRQAMADREISSRGKPRPNLQDLLGRLDAPVSALPKSITNGIGDEFVLLPAGTFWMGTADDSPVARPNEQPRHEVSFPTPFYLAVYPVTQRSFRLVTDRNPARMTRDRGGSPDHPVESVTWDDAVEYCRRLSDRETGRTYRLPTEAEWEYACRAGTETSFSIGETLARNAAAFADEDAPPVGEGAGPPRVGLFPPNTFGLHDMHGGLWEWCSDWYDERYYRRADLRAPTGPATGTQRVVRGGSWQHQARACRSAYRNALPPHQRSSTVGFRVVLESE